MNYTIRYHPLVVREDIPALTKSVKDRVRKAIELRLMTWPQRYGKPLREALKNHRKLRVGDYRVVYYIQDNTVKVWTIAHRSIVYAKALKRLAGEI